MGLFSIDSPFMDALRRLSDIIICNIFFCVLCLPVFTIGAALAGLYEAMMILITEKDDGLLFWDFLKAFKKHFKRGTLTWMICLVVLAFLRLYYKVIKTLDGSMQRTYMITFMAIVFLLAFLAQYLFPMLVYRKDRVSTTFKNALSLSVIQFPYTLLSVLLLIAAIGLSYMIYLQFSYTVLFIWGIAGFGIICYFNGMIFNQAVKKAGIESDAN